MFSSEDVKKCKRCEKITPLSAFGKKKGGKLGLNSKCLDCCKNINKQYRRLNKDKISKYNKRRYFDNHNNNLLRSKVYYRKNLEKVKIKSKLHSVNNRHKINEQIYKRCQVDTMFKIKRDVRSLIYNSFSRRSLTKSSKTEKILGCSIQEFKEYIEKKFTKGMSWDNHTVRGWHLDHIIPLAVAKTEEDVIKLCHYTNFQPLWWQENLSKSDKYDKMFIRD